MTTEMPSTPGERDLEPELDEANTVPPPSGGLIKLKTTALEKREQTRMGLAYFLLALLAAIVVVGLWGWARGADRDRLESLALMYSPIVTLMATVLGFYFAKDD